MQKNGVSEGIGSDKISKVPPQTSRRHISDIADLPTMSEIDDLVRNCQKLSEIVGNCQEIVGNCRKLSENVGNCRKMSENVGKCQKKCQNTINFLIADLGNVDVSLLPVETYVNQ